MTDVTIAPASVERNRSPKNETLMKMSHILGHPRGCLFFMGTDLEKSSISSMDPLQ